MKLKEVMDEIAEALSNITGLNVFPHPPSTIVPPAGAVSYPDRIEYDRTYRRGIDRIRGLPVVLLAGKATDRAARDKVSDWTDGDSPTSVKTVLERASYTSCGLLVVTSCEFDTVTIAAVDYLAAMFELDISGRGA